MRALSVILFCALLIPAIGCGNIELHSRQKDRDIAVDGGPSDWQGALAMVEDAGFSFGLMNDDKHLYIALVIADQAKQRQIMMYGLYLWFDETAKKEKHFSLNYPIGLMEAGYNSAEMMRGKNASDMRENFMEHSDEFLVAAIEGAWQRNSVGSLEQVRAAAGFAGGVMVLEFKVPLAQSGPYSYGVGAGPGSAISLGVESPEPDMEQMRKGARNGFAGAGGGPGGRGGGPPGIGGGRGGMGGREGTGGRRPERPQPFTLWTRVILH